MAKLFLSFTLLLLFHGCLALNQQQRNQCNIQRINPVEPRQRVESEAGFTEFFDSNDQQFQCSGVEVIRHEIQPQGLLLPSYTNAPILFYVEKGYGIQGLMLPGCPETYEVSQQQVVQGQGRQGGESLVQDRHQKIQQFHQGDVVAIPAGAAHWIYNNGQDDLVLIVLLDTTNFANQLDQYNRRFFLAGNSQQGQEQQQGRQQTPWGKGEQQGESLQGGSKNIFQGFDVEFLAEAFNIDRETAEKLQCLDDRRGHIVKVERGLQVVGPREQQQWEGQRGERGQGQGQGNGFEETICSMKVRANIDDVSQADVYNPQAGHCNHLNSLKLPILRLLQLSAERGVLHRNAIMAPHWIMNAHNIIYVTNGDMRMQIVNNQGQAVFDDVIQERQLVVVPQNFAVVKQAGERGCRWIAFRTNDNAMINTLAGRTSAIRALPVDVLTNSYQMSRDEAQKLKYNREETVLLSPSSMSSGGGRARRV